MIDNINVIKKETTLQRQVQQHTNPCVKGRVNEVIDTRTRNTNININWDLISFFIFLPASSSSRPFLLISLHTHLYLFPNYIFTSFPLYLFLIWSLVFLFCYFLLFIHLIFNYFSTYSLLIYSFFSFFHYIFSFIFFSSRPCSVAFIYCKLLPDAGMRWEGRSQHINLPVPSSPFLYPSPLPAYPLFLSLSFPFSSSCHCFPFLPSPLPPSSTSLSASLLLISPHSSSSLVVTFCPHLWFSPLSPSPFILLPLSVPRPSPLISSLLRPSSFSTFISLHLPSLLFLLSSISSFPFISSPILSPLLLPFSSHPFLFKLTFYHYDLLNFPHPFSKLLKTPSPNISFLFFILLSLLSPSLYHHLLISATSLSVSV